MPDDSNEYAREGTAAHSLGERALRDGLNADKYLGTEIPVSYTGLGGEDAEQRFTVDRDMAEAVQVYLDFCREVASQPGARMLIEQQVSLASIDPVLAPVWGTSDCTIYAPATRTLYTIDYKHGRGKAVEVDDNKQLKIYGLAAWATFNDKFKVDRVVTVIVQPRAGGEPIRQAEYTAAELLDFAQACVEAVERTEAPDAPRVPGSHCDFCKIKATCPALSSRACGSTCTKQPSGANGCRATSWCRSAEPGNGPGRKGESSPRLRRWWPTTRSCSARSCFLLRRWRRWSARRTCRRTSWSLSPAASPS